MIKSKKKKQKIIYAAGSIAAAIGAIILLPKLIARVSAYAYRKLPRTLKEPDEDEWGPEIVKTSTLKRRNEI